MKEKKIALANEGATIKLGETLAKILKGGYFVSLKGDLGMGKSTLARSIVREMMQVSNLEVPSPSFSLVQEYITNTGYNIYHCDLYRLHDPSEVLQLDLDILAHNTINKDSIYLVEWAEKAEKFLRKCDLCIALSNLENGRIATIKGKYDIICQL